jgi:hypothetical protein
MSSAWKVLCCVLCLWCNEGKTKIENMFFFSMRRHPTNHHAHPANHSIGNDFISIQYNFICFVHHHSSFQAQNCLIHAFLILN